MQDIAVLEGADEFQLGDGPVAALLVHGFTGSPQSMRPLGEYLADRGVAVVGVRLPGHGTTWQDLNARRAEEWVEAVESAFHQLVAQKAAVFVVALSFGSALSLDLAARYPDRVAGIVTLAPFLMTKDPRRFLSPVIRRLTASIPGVGNDIFDTEAREVAYARFPTSAGHFMLKFCKRARLALPAVRSPLLVIHARSDHTAHPDNARLVHDTVASTDKELVWLDRSYHVITLDVDRDEVFERTWKFIKERSGNAL